MKFVFAFIILISQAGLSMTLKDPNNHAHKLQDFFPEKTHTPFQCVSPIRFKQSIARCDFSCEKLPCEQRCQDSKEASFQMQADNCQANPINIYSSLSWSTQVTQKNSLHYGQTWIEEFLAASDFFIVPSGVFEIVFVLPPQARTVVDENGDEHLVEAIDIVLDYKQSPTSPSIGFDLILDLDQRGLEQILFFGMSTENYFIKKWGLLR